jgi:hypothetical protein
MLTNQTTLLPHAGAALRSRSVIAALLVGFTAMLASAQAPTAPLQIQPDAPDRHTVVKGDTLWGISGKFLKQPWRWPELWRMNREQIKNPHWIYPGQVMVFDRNAVGGPRLSLLQSADDRPTVVLNPQIRAEGRAAAAIPSIKPSDIEPFMVRNIVIGAESLNDAPQIVKAVGDRVAFAIGESFYAVGIKPAMGKVFHMYRKGRELRDPAIAPRPWYKWRHNEVDPQIIGYEAVYLGDAKLLRDGEVARLEVVNAKQETQIGDYLLPVAAAETIAYVPRAPGQPVEAVVMTLPNGISEAGKTNVVTLNRGKTHGLEVGHVLAAYKPVETFANPRYNEPFLNFVPGWPKQKGAEEKTLDIPEERVGLVFVFRVFDNISYGIVMNTGVENVRIGYALRNP